MSLATPQRTKKQTTVFKILAFQAICENERRNVCLKAWCGFFFFFRTGSMVDFGDCTASWISVCITQCLASWTRKRTKIQCNSVKNKTKQTHLLLHRGVNMHSCFLMRYRSLILSHFYSCGSSVPPDWPNPSRCSTSAVAGWSHLDTLKISQNSSLLQWMISPRCCRFVLKNCCWNHKESKNK